MSATYQTRPPGHFCPWCDIVVLPGSRAFPFCSQEHAAKDEEKFLRELTIPRQIKLWAKFINHQLAAWAALFELITGNRPPKIKEILAVISGH